MRLDRRVDAPGDNWPVLDLESIERGLKVSLLLAKLSRKRPTWEDLKR